ncbi:MAG: M6 family metalloprotease domain-containing protein [Gemmatimonadales bacterium]
MGAYVVRILGVSALLVSLASVPAAAQGRVHPRWEIPGFDFRADGVWRVRAREVKATRARLLSAGQFSLLNARVPRVSPNQQAGPQPAAAALTGALEVPAILLRFKDSPAAPFAAASYDSVLFDTIPPIGKPYTYRSYYRELSDGVFDIRGKAYGYATLDSSENFYAGGTSSSCAVGNPFGSTNCNGLFSSLAISRMQSALTQSLTKLDATIDFAQYVDPATGVVPVVLFLHQAMGGECGPRNNPQNHLWAHRYSLQTTFTTNDNDPFHVGQKVKISDYILQPSVGGASSCTASQIMPIGTVAHETGHVFGLPDLYDTSDLTEGIGQWGLMSSGSFTSANSPSRMEAWSLNELGWITLAPATTTGTYTFDAAPFSDTAFVARVQGANPRGEYFLLENRQRQQSDSALIRIHCAWVGSPAGCGGGLLIWHVDSAKLAQGMFSNTVNSGSIHGLAVVQADGLNNLDVSTSAGCTLGAVVAGCSDRGDAGDLYPGTTDNSGLVFRTNPAARKNADATFAGFAVDSVRQLVPDRTLSFRLRFGALTLVRAIVTGPTVQFDGADFAQFLDLLEEGSSHTIAFPSPQISAPGDTRWTFVSWSDGGAASHTITGHLAGDTITATVATEFRIVAAAGSGGTIQSDTAIDLAGTFIQQGRAVTLTAVPNSGETFGGWSGDTATLNAVLVLPMQRHYNLVATFGTLAISSATARPNGVMGVAYVDTLRNSGGTGTNSWTVTSGALPLGLTLDGPSGVISGYPKQSGTFNFTATVSSGAQNQAKAFTLSVTVPTLATANVTAQLLGPTAPLTADEVRYLDFLGNSNGIFDIGDFLAWVKTTGAPLSAATAQSNRRKGGRP